LAFTPHAKACQTKRQAFFCANHQLNRPTQPTNQTKQNAPHHQPYQPQEEEQEANTNRKVWLDAFASGVRVG
jgi:hypothetical protein